VYEDAELEALLDENSCQTQKELTLGVTQQTISYHLKSLGMIQKQGNWVPYELKARNIERRFFTCEMLLARHKRKDFLHPIVTGDEKWIYYDKKRKSWGPPGHASISTAKPNIHGKKCCVFGGISLVSCIMSCSNRTRPLLGSLPNTINEIEPSTQGKTRPLLLQA